jgi:hypothetical protein
MSPQTHYQICKDYSPINLVVRSPYTQYGHKPDTQNTSNEYVHLYLYPCLFLPELKDAGKIENYGCERKTENYCYEGKTVAMKENINNNNYSSSPNSLDAEACRFTHPLQVVWRRGLTMEAITRTPPQ